jgi:predicted lysophospholipase L1 biosynthesis ABC-type transport system permease subunit
MTGMMRIHNTELEVFNGSNWQMLSTSYATVGLDQDVLDIIQWARKKRQEENDWYKLASSNEAVRIALEQLEQAKTRLELTAILSREYETTN